MNLLKKFSGFLAWALPVVALSLSPAYGQWAFGIGNTSAESPNGVAVDGSGNVYITGIFQGTVDFDPSGGTTNLASAGNNDVFIAKYNSSGALVWADRIGTTTDEFSFGIALDASSNVHVVGYFSGTVDFDPGAGTSNLTSNGGTDIFFAKYNSSGGLVWAKNVGGTSNEVGRAIGLDGSGNVFITGEFRSTADFDPGAGTQNLTSAGLADVFVAEYTSAGVYVLALSMGGTSNDIGYGIGVDGVGLITVTGRFQGTADFDPSVSTTNLVSAGGYDIFLAQYDNTGAIQWAYGSGQTTDDYAFGLAVDNGGGDMYVTGKFEGTVDFNPLAGVTNLTSNGVEDAFFAKYDASGTLLWAKNVAGSGADFANAITFDGSGNVYVAGSFQTTLNDADFDPGAGTAILNGYGMFFAKYTSTGAYVWAKAVTAIAGSGNTAKGIAVDGSGNVYVTGVFIETADFDPGTGTTTVTNNSSNDIFLAKYTSSGVLPVQLTALAATTSGAGAELSWGTATELNSYGFAIERRKMNDGSSQEWSNIGFIAGAGTSNAPHEYSFADRSVLPGRYAYRIKQIDNDGSFQYFGNAEVEVGLTVSRFEIESNYPNPFNPTTVISYQLPVASMVHLKIFDVMGREVETLVNQEMPAGQHRLQWTASHVSSGTYFCRLEAGGKVAISKMILMK